MTYGRSLLIINFLLDEEVSQAMRYTHKKNLAQVQKAIQDNAYKALPTPSKNIEKGAVPSQINTRDQVFLKTREEGSPEDQLLPKWKGPYKVILTTPHCCQTARHIKLGTFVQTKAFTSRSPTGHNRSTIHLSVSGRSEIPVQKTDTIDR